MEEERSMESYPIRHYARPQHLAPGDSPHRFGARGGRVARTATAAVLAGLLAFPGTAFAATEVGVDGATYTEAWGDGSTWSWDGADYMELNGYNGSGISAVGDLTIDLYGDNVVNSSGEGVYVEDGDLTITGESGDGTLYVNTENYGFGIETSDGNVDVVAADVHVNSEACGIHTDVGDITIRDGSNVSANVESGVAAIHAGNYGTGSVTITDSTVEANNNDTSYAYGIYGTVANQEGVADGVTIRDSNIVATGATHAIYSEAEMVLENSDIQATTQNSEGLGSQAEEGSSVGAAIAAMGSIRVASTNLNGMGLSEQVDSNTVHYLGYADGTPAKTVAASHTGSASKFVNGVGREKSDGATSEARQDGSHTVSTYAAGSASTGTGGETGTASIATLRLASTGGDVASMVADAVTKAATAITSDPTSFAAAVGALVSGTALTAGGITLKKRRA